MPKRGKERWKDPAYTCRDCEAYYDSFSPEEKKRRVQASCRHRSDQRPAPKTPPGFWDIDFPSSPEILASGMMIDAPPPSNYYARRRRRKWRKLFEEKEKKKTEEDDGNENNRKEEDMPPPSLNDKDKM